MKRGVRGLSTVVATLIIILLVFVAIGLLWTVVRNFVQGGSDSIDLGSKCVDIVVTPTKVVHNSSQSNIYNVTLLRNSGTGEIGGVKLVFTGENSDANFVQDIPGDISVLSVKTVPVAVDISDPNNVQAVVYFIDKSGNIQYCQNSEEYNF